MTTPWQPIVAEEALLARLRAALEERDQAWEAAAERRAEAQARSKRTLAAALHEAETTRQSALARARTLRDQRLHTLEERRVTEHDVLQREYQQLRDKANARLHHEKNAAKRELKETGFEHQTVFDATKFNPRREFDKADEQVTERATRLEAIAAEAKQFLFQSRMYRPPHVDPAGTPRPENDDLMAAFLALLADSEAKLAELKGLRLPQFFQGGTPLAALILLGLLLVYPIGLVYSWNVVPLLALSGGLTIVIGLSVGLWLYNRARREVGALYDPLCQLLVDTELAKTRWRDQAQARCQRETAAIVERYRTALDAAKKKYQARRAAAVAARDRTLAAAQEQYEPRIQAFEEHYAQESTALEQDNEAAQAQADEAFATQQSLAEADQANRLAEIESRYHDALHAATERWQVVWRALHAEGETIRAPARQHFPPWNDPGWNEWRPPTEIAPVIQFGQVEVDPAAYTSRPELPSDVPPRIPLPALLEFPDRGSLLLRASGGGRVPAVEALQSVMLRYMTALPPGKLRFTIIDPVGLGQNFAGFMHLADYDELLVSYKIWTEPQQIEQRLADLSAHMSSVIQKYLRNEFETIDAYNQHAGEVAEPYRVLVVANFPFNFTETATRHLVAIANTGARCGVYTLISVDTKLTLPHGFRLGDLEQSSEKLAWRDSSFVWRDPRFEKFPLVVESPPGAELFSQLVHRVGELARGANRVEVPFEFIAPSADRWWSGDSRAGLEIPLGRAGATKRQALQLGRGTSQHVLIAGKTGSGKSTLLHALVTNAALYYSPDEVEIYLIDFKKGVEFKTYAEHRLPHARVVAIESEREFGLSVLQRLDAELKQRGEAFRAQGAQDIGAFRDATGQALPRILLVVDEFQEFFVEDDKLAQDVSLLLDRLVRQGRAFGIHVHLGSQTLGGSYSLARSTLGQMAIRIALQCSEADANLILSEENPAARLLTRPGEAIYNDANGRAEGNHLFQVVWLPDEVREGYLQRIAQLAVQRGCADREQIVFEGNLPADVRNNRLLRRAAAQAAWPTRAAAAQAWLGEAIAIKDPTAVTFRPQSGNHLAIIGQAGEAVLALMSTLVASIAVQQPPGGDGVAGGARFFFLDGLAVDAPQAGLFQRLGRNLPHPCETFSPRDVVRLFDTLAAELEQRQGSREAELPPWYVLIYDLARFRDLRKADDDFGFGRESKPSPTKQLATLLREGPALGMHVILWADTLANLQRSFDRQTIRELETRILFQMSVADSSALIDSPAASKLGPHRALLHSEEQSLLEKFRPYDLPDDRWWSELGAALRTRQPAGNASPTESA